MKSLNIVCFGDSITKGFTQGGTVFHPYKNALIFFLRKEFPVVNITADIEGLSGDWVASPPGGFLPRMDILCKPLRQLLYNHSLPPLIPADDESTIKYDWAIILGGTNDLAGGLDGEAIYSSLQKVWKYPLQNGAKVLALTVPECGNCAPQLANRRDVLNDLILEHQAENL